MNFDEIFRMGGMCD